MLTKAFPQGAIRQNGPYVYAVDLPNGRSVDVAWLEKIELDPATLTPENLARYGIPYTQDAVDWIIQEGGCWGVGGSGRCCPSRLRIRRR